MKKAAAGLISGALVFGLASAGTAAPAVSATPINYASKASVIDGLDVMMSDNDGGESRHAKLSSFSESDEAWQNASLLGTVELTGGKK